MEVKVYIGIIQSLVPREGVEEGKVERGTGDAARHGHGKVSGPINGYLVLLEPQAGWTYVLSQFHACDDRTGLVYSISGR